MTSRRVAVSIAATGRVRAEFPGTQVVVLSDRAQAATYAFRHGLAGDH